LVHYFQNLNPFQTCMIKDSRSFVIESRKPDRPSRLSYYGGSDERFSCEATTCLRPAPERRPRDPTSVVAVSVVPPFI
jgi:hypothetical protein